ncbi:MAG: hypothetical protein Q8O71_01605 [bacterium]|nr:hypothetical protein [bacterium]
MPDETGEVTLVREHSDESCAALGRRAAEATQAACREMRSVADQLAAEKRAVACLVLDGGDRLAQVGYYDAGPQYAHEVLSFALVEAARRYPSMIGVTLQVVERSTMPVGEGAPMAPIARRWPWWRRAWARVTGR